MKKRPLVLRIAFGVLVPVLTALTVFAISKIPFSVCPFRLIFGIYCPGCGVSRMCGALLRFDIVHAFLYNPLFFILFIYFGVYFFKVYISFIAGRELFPKIKITDRAAYITAGALIVFFILRNIPAAPFTYLTPDIFS